MEAASPTAPRPGRMQLDVGDGGGGWSEQIKPAPTKLGGGWEREKEKVQRAAKRYDNDGHSNCTGVRPLLLGAVVMAAKALLPQTNRRQK